MKTQRGRKSAASLAVVSEIADRRPVPPVGLSDMESSLWRSITSTKPPEWWDAGSIPLLVEYCRLKTSVDLMADEVSVFDPEWLKTDDGLRRYKELSAIRDKCQGRMTQLAMKMRLTQQARYEPAKANTAAKKTPAQRPWQSGG
jgi:hypothetical protein